MVSCSRVPQLTWMCNVHCTCQEQLDIKLSSSKYDVFLQPWVVINIIVVVAELVLSRAFVLPHCKRLLWCELGKGSNNQKAPVSFIIANYFTTKYDSKSQDPRMSFLPVALWGCIGGWGTPNHHRATPVSGSRRTPHRKGRTRSSRPEKALETIIVK